MTDKGMALYNVTALGFALDDALLYLDTHVKDPQALAYYQERQAEYNAARADYIACWGPLQQNEIAADCMHIWVATPWPWEGEE